MTDENKNRIKKQILDRLTTNFTISSACRAVGIDRRTFYRWILEDPDFKRQAYENIQDCKSDITDLAYARIVKLIDEGNLTAAMFWLNNKDPEINNKTINMDKEEIKNLLSLLYDPKTYNEGQELLTIYVLLGKISEKDAQLILKLFITKMKVEETETRKTESEIISEVLLRKKVNKLRKK